MKVKTSKKKTSAKCPTCGAPAGLCISGSVIYVPRVWWGSRKAKR